MEAKHTAWKVIEHNWQEMSVSDGEKTICILSINDGENEDDDDQDSAEAYFCMQKHEQRYNAELIASAPELLAENAKLKQEKEELIKMLEKVHEVNRIHFFNGHNVNDQILTIIQKHKKGGEE